MRRGPLHLVTAILFVLLAGCAAPTVGPGGPAEPTATGTTTPTATATPQPVGVEYVVRAGSVPDEFESATVTLRVVFVERSGDMGPCWRGTFGGPYEPTITPIRMPEGDCYRSETVTMDLADIEDGRSLGELTAPGRFSAGHALLVTNATATYRNGTTVSGMRGATGKRVRVVEGTPAGPYRVTLSIEAYEDRPYRYWLIAEDA
jgi:hypothetical protein